MPSARIFTRKKKACPFFLLSNIPGAELKIPQGFQLGGLAPLPIVQVIPRRMPHEYCRSLHRWSG